MRWGILNLFCPICATAIRHDANKPSPVMSSRTFGLLCGKECYNAAEMKYARQILGKDDEPAEELPLQYRNVREDATFNNETKPTGGEK